ncbi:GNAT family N-acetyltransferase [Litchfieldella rifensis]|uniref:GNAT family N-acetyltransferase n=1 Tax=Litchfieldella rifensis TaxID=762643 RepID=A0ABV7LQH2_9GAMM
MQLRIMEERDLEPCAQLFAQVFSADPWNEPWDDELALRRLVHFHDSSGFVGVVAHRQEVVGFALGNLEPFCTGTLFYLREMCIETTQQSKGVGTQLYHVLQRELETRHVRAVYLATDRGIPAASFYQGLGFRCSDNMAFYAKRLVAPSSVAD